jgi:hypothetical protein
MSSWAVFWREYRENGVLYLVGRCCVHFAFMYQYETFDLILLYVLDFLSPLSRRNRDIFPRHCVHSSRGRWSAMTCHC